MPPPAERSHRCKCRHQHCGMGYPGYCELMANTGRKGDLYTKMFSLTCGARMDFEPKPLSISTKNQPFPHSAAFDYIPSFVQMQQKNNMARWMMLFSVSQKTIRKRSTTGLDCVYACSIRMEQLDRRRVEILSEILYSEMTVAAGMQTRSILGGNFTVLDDDFMAMKPLDGQLLVDEMCQKFIAVFYRRARNHKQLIITVLRICLDKSKCGISHYSIAGPGDRDTEQHLQFKLDRDGDYVVVIVKKTTDRTLSDCFATMKYMIPIEPELTDAGSHIYGPISCILQIPRKRLDDLVRLQKTITAKMPNECVNMMRLAGRYDEHYLGKIKSWRIYRNFASPDPDGRPMEAVIAVTRSQRSPRMLVLSTGLTKDWFDQMGFSGGDIFMLPSGKLAWNMLLDTKSPKGWVQAFKMLGAYPDAIVKKCGNCKKTTGTLEVCRICKKKDYHLQWWKTPCHFCSGACFKAAWSQHKNQHSRK